MDQRMGIYHAISTLIAMLFIILTGYLFLLSAFSTTAIDALEHSYLVRDHALLQMFLAAAIVVLCTLLYARFERFQAFVHRINEDQAFSEKWRRRLLFLLADFCIVMLLTLQKVPRGDQRFICDMANSMMNGDYYGFDRGQYLDMYPNQIGMVLLLYCLAHIFGSYNYLLFQFLNVAALVLLYHDMAEFSDETGHSRFTGLCIIGLGCVFLPAMLYTTFVYGTLLGLTLSIRALRHLRSFLRMFPGSKRELVKSIGTLLVAGLDAFAAVAVKTNYQIFVIALLIYTWLIVFQTYTSLRQNPRRRFCRMWQPVRQHRCCCLKVTYQCHFQTCNRWKAEGKEEIELYKCSKDLQSQLYDRASKMRLIARAFIVTIMLASVLLFTQRVLNNAAHSITGRDISEGLSPWSWVVMGLEENSERYDGWYNGYGPDTYLAANSSGERQKPVARRAVQQRIQYFKNHPLDAVRFLVGKNASQWNNPDFQSFWIVNHARHTVQYSRIIHAMFSPDGIVRIDVWLNFLQFLILMGALLGAFPRKNGKNWWLNAENLFLELCMIGGFLFYSVWEAKAQYTLVHFMCLLPLAVYGYEETVSAVHRAIAALEQRFESDIDMSPSDRSIGADAPSVAFGKTAFADFASVRYKNASGLFCRGSKSLWQICCRGSVSRIWIVMLTLICVIGAERKNELIASTIVRQEDTKSYEQYLRDHRYVRLEQGSLEDRNETFTLHYSHYDDHCYLITDDGRALTAGDAALEEDESLQQLQVELSGCVYSSAQSWYIRDSQESGKYYLIHTWNEKEWALTRDDSGEIVLDPFAGTLEQRWKICKQESSAG